MTEALLPCPFCGKEPRWYKDLSEMKIQYSIECLGCGVQTQFDDQGITLAIWNRRYKSPSRI